MAKRRVELVRKGPRVSPRSGLVKVLVSIEPGQHEALRAEALRRAVATGDVRPGVSEIVREALASYLKGKR